MTVTKILRPILTATLPVALAAGLLAGCESSDDDAGNYWTTEKKKTSSSSASASAGTSSGSTSSSSSSSSKGSSSSSSSGSKSSSGSGSSGSSSGSGSSSSSGSSGTTVDAGAVDEVPFSSFHWKFGGENGSGAKKTSASIGHLSVGKSSLSYRWTGPTLRSWGLSDGDPGAMACFFVMKDDGTWVGGKFDWISTSRTSRGFENIRAGYGGWSLAGVPNPCACAFVIISGDRKKRTNVIAGRWSR